MIRSRTWRWFTVRLFGLSTDSRTWTKLRGLLGEHEDDDTDGIDRELGVSRPE